MRARREEYDAAAQVALDAFKAIERHDGSIAADAYLDEAIMIGYTGGVRNFATREGILRAADNSRAGEGFNYRADVIELEEEVAIVRILENNYAGNYYTCYLTEIKDGGTWKVASFVYNHNKHAYED